MAMNMKTKYHLITYRPECGYDDRDDVNTMQQAKQLAKCYLGEWDGVYIFNEEKNTLVRVFDKNHKNGRKPYNFEINKFNY